MPTNRRVERMKKILACRQPDLTVVCENIHDPHNVSAILRSCDAVGIPEIHLLYNQEEFPKLGKKSSASAKKWIRVARYREPAALRSALKAAGFTIYATHVSAGARSIYEIDWTGKCAVIMGNEHSGVSDAALKIADRTIEIPMFGMVKSLNVSVATAVILYEALRQRQAKGLYPRPDLPPEKLEALLTEWLEK